MTGCGWRSTATAAMARSPSATSSRSTPTGSERPPYARAVPPDAGQDRAHRLMTLLGLSEEELWAVLDADPAPPPFLPGQLEHRPRLPILLDLLAEAEERAGAPVLRRWVRATGRGGRPIDRLVSRDFAGFEDALADLADRGFVLRGGAG